MYSHLYKVVNVCEIVYKYIKTNFINQTKLAGEIGTSKANLNNRLKAKTMDVGMLYNISLALKHDFFQYLSKDLNQTILKDNNDFKTTVTFQNDDYVSLLQENIELYRKIINKK